jgi:hypothetical protein
VKLILLSHISNEEVQNFGYPGGKICRVY